MISLITSIGERLRSSAYSNEAAITHGIVSPILSALGWDTSDPKQVRPEFANGRGRVDFALIGLGQKPAVFIEVKAVGRGLDGDRQLFGYAFQEGVPLCVLTDGREWNFYLPSGLGNFDDRRLYRLQLDDRDPAECEAILVRYLARERILDHSAFSDAMADHRDAAGRRQAIAALPGAWKDLLDEAHELVLDALMDKAEGNCGYKPTADDALQYLRSITARSVAPAAPAAPQPARQVPEIQPAPKQASADQTPPSPPVERGISFRVLGKTDVAPNAASALTEMLRLIVATDPARIVKLSDAVRSRKRSHIDRTPELINPARPDLARAAEIYPGWLVGLTISNRDKMMILRTACDIYDLCIPQDVEIDLPNV